MSEAELEENDAEAVFRKAYTDEKLNEYIGVFQETQSTLAKAIINPEKVLYENKRYQECILYIQSLENFYTDYYITYLIKAYVSTGDYSSARAIINLYADSKVNEKDITLKYLNGVIESTEIDKLYMAEKMLDSQLSVKNPCYENDEEGHMIANKNIEVGETILLEVPMLSIGKGKCSNCFCDSALSKCCQNCNRMYYCSKSCTSKDKPYHQWECAFYKTCYANEWNKRALRLFLKMLLNCTKNNALLFDRVQVFYDSINQHPQKSAINKGSLQESFWLTTYLMGKTELKKSILQSKQFANCPENRLCTKLGGTVLKLIIFCKYKAFSIFDKVLGTSFEFYLRLSKFKFSCQPNTIISRTSNKIVLKASQEIEKGKEISCDYSDVINITFLDFLLNCNSKIIENCKFFYLNNKNPLLIYSTFKTANELILDKNHLLLQGIYFEFIRHEMCSGNFGNMCEYLPIIMNTSYIQLFKSNHVEICSCLMHHMKSIFALAKLPLHILEVLIDYLKFLEEDVYPRYPNEILLHNVKIMQSHYTLAKDINNMNKVVPMKASVA